jgi:hypothetical protein
MAKLWSDMGVYRLQHRGCCIYLLACTRTSWQTRFQCYLKLRLFQNSSTDDLLDLFPVHEVVIFIRFFIPFFPFSFSVWAVFLSLSELPMI